MQITLEIQRFDCQKDQAPYLQTYMAEAEPDDRLLTVLMAIKRHQDPTLGFRKSCAHGVCGSDAMVINGKERLACKTLVKDVLQDDGSPVRIEPLRSLPVQRDLMVDQSAFFEKFAKAKPYYISHSEPPEKERLQSPEDREHFDNQTNCIQCAACYSTCPVVRERNSSWLGPSSIVNAARFIEDSRDEGFEERLPVLDAPDGVWPCESQYECTRQCPRGIMITKHINLVKQRIRAHTAGDMKGTDMGGHEEKTWVCTVCGYVHYGPEPPEICPQCGATADMYELQEEPAGTADATAAAEEKAWVCTVCGYVHHGPEPPGICPQCGSPAEMFEPYEDKQAPVKAQETKAVSEKRTISDIMAETMVAWGVTHVFGIVGHSNLGFADALRRQVMKGNLEFIGVRHETAAAFAASAYAKLTGRPAACLSIAGPGATNLLTGLWDAKVDRAPILALTGQVETQVLGPGAFQEVDLASAFLSVAAWSQTVLASSNHAELMTLALKHAILKRDVGHLIIPNEVQTIPAKDGAAPSGPEGRLPSLDISPPKEALDEALDLVAKSERPVVVAGHGARFHMDEVVAFAEQINAPVITTFKAKGQIPDSHPLACGVLGLSGTPVSNHFMRSADLLVVFGASFSHHTGIATDIPTIQVDYDPITLGKFHSVRVPVYGEIGATAALLRGQLANIPGTAWQDRRQELAEHWKAWRAEKERRAAEEGQNGLSSAAVFAAMGRCVPENAVIAVDVGNNTYSFGRYFECKRQSIIMSGYLGSIGFGYPAAMGAWAAAPDRPILAVTGDGGFGQYMCEICTAVKYGMNITHVLLNNSELGKISAEQRSEHFDVWSTSLHNPNFARYAEICGAKGVRVTSPSQLDEALTGALAHDGPALVEVITETELV